MQLRYSLLVYWKSTCNYCALVSLLSVLIVPLKIEVHEDMRQPVRTIGCVAAIDRMQVSK